MPILKGASSDFTDFVKSNAQAIPAGSIAPKVVATSVPAPKLSVTATLTKATAVAAVVAPKTTVVSQADLKTNTKSTR